MSSRIPTILLVLLAACSKKEAPSEPPPSPTVPADAPTFVGCPYQIWPSHLEPLADGTILIAPQREVGSDAPQYAPAQRLAADGSTKPAGAGPHRRRDREWFVGDDGGSICIDYGDNTSRDCVGYELDRELAALDGYIASALDPQGRFFVMTFRDEKRPFGVTFDGTGKRLATWQFSRACEDERPELVVGRHAVQLCQGASDHNGYSSLTVRDVRSGAQVATIAGTFSDMEAVPIDDTRFVVYRRATPEALIEVVDLRVPSSPKVVWSVPHAFVKPAIAVGAGGIVVIERDAPWRGVMLDAATGALRKEIAIDPCMK